MARREPLPLCVGAVGLGTDTKQILFIEHEMGFSSIWNDKWAKSHFDSLCVGVGIVAHLRQVPSESRDEKVHFQFIYVLWNDLFNHINVVFLINIPQKTANHFESSCNRTTTRDARLYGQWCETYVMWANTIAQITPSTLNPFPNGTMHVSVVVMPDVLIACVRSSDSPSLRRIDYMLMLAFVPSVIKWMLRTI